MPTHPTYFRFKDHLAPTELTRSAHIGQRFRLTLETDVENSYFRRPTDPGELTVKGVLDGAEVPLTFNMNLFDGFGHLNVALPDSAGSGSILELTVTVTDYTIVEEFVNLARVSVLPPAPPSPGGDGERTRSRPPNPSGANQIKPAGIELPEIRWVQKSDWESERWSKRMDESSGMRATLADAEDEVTGISKYDFWVNADNIYLQTELKATKLEPELLKARFKYGMALVGLGALRSAGAMEKPEAEAEDDPEDQSGEDLVALASDVVAPVLLPMIDGLGGLDLDEGDSGGSVDDDDLGESVID